MKVSLQTALLVIGIIGFVFGENEWKPFDYLAVQPTQKIQNLNPSLSVQSVLAEGLGWEDLHPLSTSHAFHVVISLTGSAEKGRHEIPIGGQKIMIKAQHSTPCLIEQGNGGFDDCSLNPTKSRIFNTNSMGRVSFSIPVEELQNEHVAPLLIRSDFMKPDEWMVAHVDADVHSKLAKIQPEEILKLNSQISSSQALSVSKSVSYLMSLSHGAMPLASKHLHHDTHQILARSALSQEIDDETHPGLVYDSTKNHISTYLVKIPENSAFILKRSLGNSGDLHKRETKSQETQGIDRLIDASKVNLNSLGLATRDLHLVDDSSSMVLFGTPKSKALVLAQEEDGWKLRIVETMEEAWKLVVEIFKKIGVTIKAIYDALASLFKWDEISHTVSFLSLFYRKLAPLSLRGINLIRDQYLSLLHNVTRDTEDYFAESMAKLGVKDLTYESSRNMATDIQRNTTGSTDTQGPLDADAKTLMIHDRVMNNLPNASMDPESQTLFDRLITVFKEGAASLAAAVDPRDLLKAAPHRLAFTSTESIAKMGLAQMLNIARSIAVSTEQFVGNTLAAVMQFLPLYWNLAEALMTFPLKIPFVNNMWERKFGGESIFSILDILCLMGGVYGNAQYALYNGHGPFTATDIQVLNSAPNPELLLYTWNNDPRTYAMDNPALREHRLGIYDWMPKCHFVVVWIVKNTLYDLTLLVDPKGSLGSPGKHTYIPQVLDSLFEMIGPISQYPFTQLETNDPVVMKNSIDHPDGFWYTWLVDLFVRAIRPFLGTDSAWNNAPLKPFADFVLLAAPTTFFALKIQKDTGKYVSRNDYPRIAVLAIGWVEIMGYYYETFLPFIPDNILTNKAQKIALIAKHMAINTLNTVKMNILIGFNIAGMMSSSFQPKDEV